MKATPVFLNLEEVEGLAKNVLPQMVFDYYSGGSESCSAIRENRDAFSRYRILPRMLVDVSSVNMKTSFLGGWWKSSTILSI